MINHIPEDLFYGIQVSDCLLPCLRTTATVRKKMTTTMPPEWENGESTLVCINFDNEVRVRKTSMDKFSFMTFLNFLGSNLGLWPGLGLYQIFELLTTRFCIDQVICEKLRSFFRLRTVINTS